MNESPYRSDGSSDDGNVLKEMEAACQFLLHWERFEPVIGGGALWAWASGHQARDVDVFVRESWRSRRWANKIETTVAHERMCTHPARNEYGDWISKGDVEVFRYITELTNGTKVDLVLTPWTGIEAIDHFDYEHCMVGFGPVGFTTRGVDAYARGSLNIIWPNHARSDVVIKSKIYGDLWGNTRAVMRMENTIHSLQKIYKQVKDVAR